MEVNERREQYVSIYTLFIILSNAFYSSSRPVLIIQYKKVDDPFKSVVYRKDQVF